MADQYDAVNPHNLPGTLAGLPATRISVLADAQADALDFEAGNAGAAAVAAATRTRFDAGLWTVEYLNRGNAQELRQAVTAAGVPWVGARSWPAPGAYIWAATGGAPPGFVPAWCWVSPLLVQDRYEGIFDVSTCFGAWPGRAAGYLDGAESAKLWTPEVWALYPRVTAPPAPEPIPPLGAKPVYLFHTESTEFQVFDDGTCIELPASSDGSHLADASTAGGLGLPMIGPMSDGYAANLIAAKRPPAAAKS